MMAIATILTMLFFGILGSTFNYTTANRLAGATEDLHSSQAFYVAQGGMQYVAMSKLNGDTNFADNVSSTGAPFGGTPITLGQGQFWFEYSNQATDSITVKVTAKVGDAVRVVEQNVGQEGTGFTYVTMAEGNVNINSGSGDVYGDVGLGGEANIDHDVTVHGNITEDRSIEAPTMDLGVYQAMCTDTYSGNKTFNANYTGNLCVTGNATFNANVTYTGVLYVGGNVTISGNNVHIIGSIVAHGNITGSNRTGLQFLPQASEGVHMPALVSDGNIDLKNDDGMQVNGVMWSDGNMDFTNSDNVSYTGSFMTGGNIIFNTSGNLQLTFDADLLVGVPGLGALGGGATGSLSLSSWKTYAPW